MANQGGISVPERSIGAGEKRSVLIMIFPFLRWFKYYTSSQFRADFISGLTVALVLIPQSMAYAQLAGLPPYYGLYAALLPPIPLATAGSEQFIAYAILLALLVGLFQFSLGVLRLGLVVNFLSHPVVSGFTNAAAIIIATSQLSKLFGVYVDFAIMAILRRVDRRIPNVLIAVIVTTIISYLIGFDKNYIANLGQIKDPRVQHVIQEFNTTLNEVEEASNKKVALRNQLRVTEKRSGKHSIEAIALDHDLKVLDLKIEGLKEESCALRSQLRAFHLEGVQSEDNEMGLYLHGNVPTGLQGDGRRWRLKVGNFPLDLTALRFMSGGAVVGTIPRGVPKFALPMLNFTAMLDLLTMAIIISLLGFMEAISIAKAMAAKTGQRLDPNQELIGQGLANIVGAFNSSYPVSGSFSRSAVNLQAGAVTGLSNVFSSLVVLITLLFLTPLLYHLPQSVLASIIIMAVINLINPRGFLHTWLAQKYDGAIAIITFLFTLGFAPHLDKGIMIGVALSLGHFLFRNIRPEMAVLSKWEDGTYRNADRRGLQKCRHIAVIRFNNSLFFATVNYLEEKILEPIAHMPELRHIHVVGNGINELDASGVEVLADVVERVREAGYDFSMSGLNDHVMEAMRRTHLLDRIGEDHIYGNVELAVKSLYRKTHENTREKRCPLLEYIPPGDSATEKKNAVTVSSSGS